MAIKYYHYHCYHGDVLTRQPKLSTKKFLVSLTFIMCLCISLPPLIEKLFAGLFFFSIGGNYSVKLNPYKLILIYSHKSILILLTKWSVIVSISPILYYL